MSESSSDVNPLDALAEEFVARHRRGEHPSLDEFIARRPDLADDIRDLFPGLVVMEGVRSDRGDSTGPFAPGPAPMLKRLGDYRILREVGRGGMGVVYEAEQESLGRHVALKVLPAHALLDPQRLRRFHREAKAAARLHHTNIVPVYGVGEQDGLHYYVMQFIQGQGLDQVLDELKQLRQSRQGGPPKHHGAESAALSLLTGKFAPGAAVVGSPGADAAGSPEAAPSAPRAPESSSRSDTGRAYWESVARIGIQTAQALAYAAAQGTLHRDIKPSNLLLDAHGNLWVTDFGLAKAADSEDLTHTGDIVGTLRYMAPERFSGKGDLRSDLYSLGLTLYELLALRPAFEAPDRQQLVHQALHGEPPRLRQLDRAIPRDLETIVHKAIDKDLNRRYPTAQELADDLQRFLDDRPIRARRVGALEKAWRWSRRNPAVAALSAAVMLLLVGLAVGATVAAYTFRATADREAKLAGDERKAHGEAVLATEAANYNAQLLRDNMTRLYEVNALLESARTHETGNEWEQAHADLTKAVERMPEYALVWRERADLYYRLGLEEEALGDLTREFDLKEPEEPELWFRYAGLRLQQGDAAGYRAVCTRMQERFSTDNNADPVLLSLACCLGPDGPAVPEWQVRRLEQAAPQRDVWGALARVALAAVKYRAGQIDEAVRWLQEPSDLEAPPDFGASLAWEIAALIQHRNGHDDLAERPFLEAVDTRLASLHSQFHFIVGSAAERWRFVELQEGLALYKEAVEAVRGAKANDPPGAWERRAQSHQALGQRDRAASDLTRALRREPEDPALLIWRARLYDETDQRDRADADLTRFAAAKSDSVSLWAQACDVRVGRQEWDAAADLACQALVCLPPAEERPFYGYLAAHDEVYSRVAGRRPDDFELRVGCAEVGRTLQKHDRAVEWITDALRLKPDDPAALFDRANWNADLGRWRQAADDFDRLLKVRAPQKADDLLPLALLRAYLDDREGYRDVCRRMVKEFGKDPEAQWAVAEALALAPNDAADMRDIQQRLTDPVGASNGWTYAWVGLRAGKEQTVLDMYLPPEGMAAPNYPADWLLLALAHHRLGRPGRARECLKEAERIIEEQTRQNSGDVRTKSLGPMGWADPLRILLLRREAETLLKEPALKPEK